MDLVGGGCGKDPGEGDTHACNYATIEDADTLLGYDRTSRTTWRDCAQCRSEIDV